MKRFKSAYVVLSLLWVLVLTGYAQAGDFLTMSPGESTVREFLLYNAFDAQKLGPAATFIVLGIGSADTFLGNLTVQVTPNVKKDFGKVIDISILGFAYAYGGDVPFAMISGGSTVPLKATQIVPLNAQYAFAAMIVFISSVDGPGDWEKPGQFAITFEMGSLAQEAAE